MKSFQSKWRDGVCEMPVSYKKGYYLQFVVDKQRHQICFAGEPT